MSKLNQNELAFLLESKGHDKKQAAAILNDLCEIVSTALCEGNSVSLKGVGVLTGIPTAAEERKIGGKDTMMGERLRVTFKTSSKLKSKYKAEFSKAGTIQAQLRNLNFNS